MAGFGDLTDNDYLTPKRRLPGSGGSPFDSLSPLTQGTPMAGMNMTPVASGFGSSPFGAPSSTAPSLPSPSTLPIAASDPMSAGAKPGNTSSKNLQTIDANLYNQDLGTRGQLLNQIEGNLDFSKIPSTPLYKANLTGANEATSSAYDRAMINTKANAAQRGFGLTSPVEQGAESGIRAQEAGAMAKNPASALLQTVQPNLQSAGILDSAMKQFDPASVLQNWEDLVKSKGQASAGMMQGLMAALGQLGSAGIAAGAGGAGGAAAAAAPIVMGLA